MLWVKQGLVDAKLQTFLYLFYFLLAIALGVVFHKILVNFFTEKYSMVISITVGSFVGLVAGILIKKLYEDDEPEE